MKKDLNSFKNQAIKDLQNIKGGTYSFRKRTGKSAGIKEKRVYTGK